MKSKKHYKGGASALRKLKQTFSKKPKNKRKSTITKPLTVSIKPRSQKPTKNSQKLTNSFWNPFTNNLSLHNRLIKLKEKPHGTTPRRLKRSGNRIPPPDLPLPNFKSPTKNTIRPTKMSKNMYRKLILAEGYNNGRPKKEKEPAPSSGTGWTGI